MVAACWWRAGPRSSPLRDQCTPRAVAYRRAAVERSLHARPLLAGREYHSSFPARHDVPQTCIGLAVHSRPDGDMSDQTYDDGRARNLEDLLRALADRIRELDAEGRLLANPAELTRLIGDVKSELFHYEVRATYDTPEVADSRRIVNEAIQRAEQGESWQEREWTEDGDDAPEW